MQILNRMVLGHFDFIEIQAMRHRPICISDYVEHLDGVLASSGQPVFDHTGTVSHKQAMEKAEREYCKYLQHLSSVEEDYLRAVKRLGGEAKGGAGR